MSLRIRPAAEADSSAINEICFQTYEKPGDDRYRRLAGLRWAEPYLRYDRDHCFVADDEGRIAGYVVCARNARDFRKKFHHRMKDDIRNELSCIVTDGGQSISGKERWMLLHYPDAVTRHIEKEFPAHLHINVHPEFQGRGLGAKLLDGLVDHLGNIGCPGVHLGVAGSNKGGIRFYERYGFKCLRSLPGVLYYGFKTDGLKSV